MTSKSDRPLSVAFEALFQSPQSIEYAIVDAFIGDHSKGNPAAVVLLPRWKDDKWLQDVAAEFNLSETAYIVKKQEVMKEESVGTGTKEGNQEKVDCKDDSDSKPVIHEFDLRWFTPNNEVDLCGHATLASAHLLHLSGVVPREDKIFFHTRSGLLSIRSVGLEGRDTEYGSSDRNEKPRTELVEMNFPWITTTPASVSALETLPRTLSNVVVVAVGKSSNDFLIVELESSEDLDKLQPNMQELVNCDSDGFIATAPAGKASGFDFVSRCFFPKFGVPEDPVTGTAHCILGPYWSTKLHKTSLLAHQASKRGGLLALQVDKKLGRVYIRGQSAIFMTGVLLE